MVLSWLRRWADLLDSRFRIPGTQIRFGIDPILSLIPGLGELASPIFALLLIAAGVQIGVPKVVLLRMLINALLDALIGAIPVAGTIGDIFWRANTANLALLERHAVPGRRPTGADYAFVGGAAAVLGILVAAPVIAGVWLAIQLWQALVSLNW